ncbi:MAG TPA: precorrin-2 C(20)-methyltransferase [Candidatus Tectomicrobia bacterium]
MSWGTFYGIGMGPGDPELLTRKAFRLLAEVPVIFYPSCGGKADGFALDILQGVFAEDYGGRANGGMGLPSMSQGSSVLARCRPLSTTMVRGADTARPHWADAAEHVAAVLQNGQDAAFITEGDPALYSTFVYLQVALAERFPEARIEIVPGVSSMSAAAARTLFPLALGEERIAILPATYDPPFLERALEAFDTIVLLKVNRVLDQLITILERHGLLDGAVFVERCGTSRERIIRDVSSLRGQRMNYFSLLLVRKEGVKASRL